MKKIYLIITLFLLSGCIPKSPHKMNMYDIAINTHYISPTKSEKTVKLKYPNSLGGVGSSRIYFKRGGITSYYLYSRWSNSLNLMIYKNILNNLIASNKFKNVLEYNSVGKSDLLLEIDIIDFYHIVEKNRNYLECKIKVNVINAKDSNIIKSKLFNYQEDINKADAKHFYKKAVEVINKFTLELMEEL